MRVTSLGFRTDVALRGLEGAETTDRGDYLVVRTPGHPGFYWGHFLLLDPWPGPGRVPAGRARRAGVARRGRPRRGARGVPRRWPGSRTRHGAHLHRRAAA